jgi:hypothetical protein
MLAYYAFFPAKIETELRTATFVGAYRENEIPSGTYLFTEFYCTDTKCDCQRLLVKVLRVRSEHERPEDVATISYTWNAHPDGTWAAVTAGMPNPFLDPFHYQARYAEQLLDFWSDMVARDHGYAERLQRHYHELRAAVGQAGGGFWRAVETDSRVPRKLLAMPSLTRQERRARKRRTQKSRRARKCR